MIGRLVVKARVRAAAVVETEVTPNPVIDKLVSSMQAPLKDPAVQQKFTELGAVSYPADKQNPAALQQHLKAEIEKWGPLIKKAGVYAD